MNQRTLKFLSIGVVALMILLLGVKFMSGGIDSTLVAKAEAELRKLNEIQQQVNVIDQEVSQSLLDEADLFASGGYDTAWPAELTLAKQKLQTAAAAGKKVGQILEANDPSSKVELEVALGELAVTRQAGLAQAQQVRSIMRKLLKFKSDPGTHLMQMTDHFRVIQRGKLGALKIRVDQAAVDWPGKQHDVQGRLTVLEQAKQQAQQSWDASQAARQAGEQGQLNAGQIHELMNTAITVETARTTFENGQKQLPVMIDQLYTMWDEILEDMEIREGSEVTFYQKVKTVRLPAMAGDGATVQPQIEPGRWKQVSKSEFERFKDKLGMTIRHKPGGKYDYEAQQMVQPPGYAYLASPEQGRNRYGYWNRSGGSSFWVFYGQYSMMRHLFWGSSYRPISGADYRGYGYARSRGQTYYGTDQYGRRRYGSRGTATRSSYGNSKYVRSGGFRNTRYMQSGGKYRGSRYGGSGSYRSSSRRSSGSRFGSGK